MTDERGCSLHCSFSANSRAFMGHRTKRFFSDWRK
nr:MAG TPA: Radical SAM superfamily [Caudoviricetes sp.]